MQPMALRITLWLCTTCEHDGYCLGISIRDFLWPRAQSLYLRMLFSWFTYLLSTTVGRPSAVPLDIILLDNEGNYPVPAMFLFASVS
ncbi:hypothetical protein A0H81_03365 [Grifola frondosa]|uniref:Uncharacterized protein n=1 Tax=Grifola frondosa TaxID=5627 RepID=A0A1C7MJK4_GRIFR|nr:hypothetical protein A0H81_03365 [Grifola frondosa]